MSRIHIIADASWDKDTKLGGYAGGVAKYGNDGSEVTKHYAGYRAEMYDANSGEGLAVIAGLRTLLKMQRHDPEPIESVYFHTDSATIIRQYEKTINGEEANPKYAAIVNEIMTLSSKLGESTSFEFKKVKAHVNNTTATAVERLHNLIDLEAKQARLSLHNHIIKPDIENSNYYACILPAMPKSVEYGSLSALGYGMANKGMIARVRFVGDMKMNMSEHPFIAGVERAAAEKGTSPQSLVSVVRRGESDDILNGTAFLDRTIIRMHQKKNGLTHRNMDGFDSYVMSQGAVANRLMYGLQTPLRINLSHPTGRIEPASKFIIDLTHGLLKRKPSTIGDWVKSFSEINKIPVVNTLDRALMLNDIPEPKTLLRNMNDKDSPTLNLKNQKTRVSPRSSGRNQTEQVRGLFITVHSLLTRFAHSLEPSELHAKIHEKLIKVGVKNSPTLSSELFSVCQTFKGRSDNPAILAVLAAVARADVPQNTYEHTQNNIEKNSNNVREEYTPIRKMR